MMIRFAYVLIALVTLTWGKAINNKLIGQPTVRCGPDRIEVEASAESPFEGVVYIKHWRSSEGCFSTFGEKTQASSPKHAVPLSQLSSCGMDMRRNADNKELEIFGVFVFSFHPMFVTYGDRAFAVHCIFKQQDFTVGHGFDITDITTRDTLSRTASMPTVGMKIVRGGVPDITVEAARTVRVGEPLMFIWHLPVPSDVYGLKVGDCSAETLSGRRAKVLEEGCSLDVIAIGHISYSEDRSRAFAAAMAFKFADDEDLWFKCSVSVCIKRGEGPLLGTMEDSCHTPKKCNSRVRRDASEGLNEPLRQLYDDTLLQQKLLVLDDYNQHSPLKHSSKRTKKNLSLYSGRNSTESWRNIKGVSDSGGRRGAWRLCMRKPVFALVSSVILIMYIITFVMGAFAVVLYCNRRQPKYSSASTVSSPQILISS